MYSIDVQHAQPDPRIEELLIENAEPHIQKIAENNFTIANLHVQISPYAPIWIVVDVAKIIDQGIFDQRQRLVFQFRVQDPNHDGVDPYYLKFEAI